MDCEGYICHTLNAASTLDSSMLGLHLGCGNHKKGRARFNVPSPKDPKEMESYSMPLHLQDILTPSQPALSPAPKPCLHS